MKAEKWRSFITGDIKQKFKEAETQTEGQTKEFEE